MERPWHAYSWEPVDMWSPQQSWQRTASCGGMEAGLIASIAFCFVILYVMGPPVHLHRNESRRRSWAMSMDWWTNLANGLHPPAVTLTCWTDQLAKLNSRPLPMPGSWKGEPADLARPHPTPARRPPPLSRMTSTRTSLMWTRSQWPQSRTTCSPS